jgi:hypothetical protein
MADRCMSWRCVGGTRALAAGDVTVFPPLAGPGLGAMSFHCAPLSSSAGSGREFRFANTRSGTACRCRLAVGPRHSIGNADAWRYRRDDGAWTAC